MTLFDRLPSRNGLHMLLVATLACALCAAPGLAQDEASGSDESVEDDTAVADAASSQYTEEIVVTARRREENLQQTPISMTAFTADALEQRSLENLSQISSFTPNLDYRAGSGFANDSSDATIFIRGIGQGDVSVFTDPGVGLYIDGVYLARAQGALLDLLDIEQVEVLRGPQGTLFGKNTTGGAIQVITRRPGRELGGTFRGTIGDRDLLRGSVTLDLPLTDALHGSVSLLHTEQDGFSRSLVTGQEFGDDGRDLLRLALEWGAGSSTDGYWSFDYLEEDETGSNQLLVGFADAPLLDFYNQAVSDQGFVPYTDVFLSPDFQTSFALAESKVEGEVWGTALHLGWTRRELSFQSISAFRAFEYDTAGDGDASPARMAEAVIHREQDQISQEFQLQGTTSSADWVVGALYFQETPYSVQRQKVLGDLFAALELAPGPIYAPPGVPDFLCNPGPPPPGLPCFGGAGNPLNFAFFSGDGVLLISDLETTSLALFGESTWRVNDRTSITVGARWTEDDKEFAYTSFNGLGLQTDDLFNQETFSDWSGRLSVAYQANDDLMLYGNIARGFKSGGFNGRPQGRGVLDPFDPEIALTYEAGFKSDLADRKVRLNGSVFFTDYTDIHFSASLETNGAPVFVTQNAGDAEIAGFELETELHPAQGFVIQSTLGYLDTELTRVDPTVPAGIDVGNRLPKSPEWSYSLSLQKAFTLGNDSSLIARADYSYTSKIYANIANDEPIVQDALGLVSARLVYGPYSGAWELALYGTNLTDEDYLAAGFFATAFGPFIGTAGPPRDFGMTATFRF